MSFVIVSIDVAFELSNTATEAIQDTLREALEVLRGQGAAHITGSVTRHENIMETDNVWATNSWDEITIEAPVTLRIE